MVSNVINIDVDYSLMGVKKSPKQTTLATYILDEEYLTSTENKKRPAVIVCPGAVTVLFRQEKVNRLLLNIVEPVSIALY